MIVCLICNLLCDYNCLYKTIFCSVLLSVVSFQCGVTLLYSVLMSVFFHIE